MKAKKSLGQNFLKSEAALRKIIEVGEVKSNDTILEIGPGKGALTEKLLERAGEVIAVEKDHELFEFLKEKFATQIKKGGLTLLNEDILNINAEQNILQNYKIIANIPYNITGAILKKFLAGKRQPTLMVLMVQQEVAQRIVARDGKESLLSISVKAYGEPKLITKVPARYFVPAPKVDSAIIMIKNVSRDFFVKNKINEEKFWEMVKVGFAHKRKKISGNLKTLKNQVNKEFFEEIKDKRAENISLEGWSKLLKS